jgi:hypothetical protein
MVDGRKQSTITRKMFADKTVDHIILMSDYLGFRSSYLAQQRIRMFRCAIGITPEASTILETFPDEVNGVDEQWLRKHLAGAMSLYMCFEDNRFQELDVDAPVKDDDNMYGSPNEGLHIIFNAWEDDAELDHDVKQRDVVSDGNLKMSRWLCEDEKKFRTDKSHRPKAPAMKKPATSRTHIVKKKPAAFKKKAAPSRSRCGMEAGDVVEETHDPRRNRSEGVYAVRDMRTNEILLFAEMLNPECKPYKVIAARMIAAKVKVGVHCHDCACTQDDFEGVYCKRVMVDAWHVKKHKCCKKRYDPKHKANLRLMKGCNTSAAEQLWSRTNRLSVFVSQMGRGFHRMFLKQWCVWRNKYERKSKGKKQDDVPPAKWILDKKIFKTSKH